MGIEKIITFMISNASRKYLDFQPDEQISIPRGDPEKKFFLYIHIPFCESLCPYCSFNRFLFDEKLSKQYFAALRLELEMYRELGYDCDGICIGGGTPTISMDELGKTIAKAEELYSIKEITVETNPNHLNGDNIRQLRDMGVNRLSVGVQSFNNDILKKMERYDKYGSGEEIRSRIERALGNFDTLNIDMMFNFPFQTKEMLEKDIDILLETGVDQVIFYPLMMSPLTSESLSEKWGPLDSRQEKTFYYRILERLSKDYTSSTPWCFSRSDAMIDEYIVNYDEYIGLGSGSFSYLNGTMYANTFSIPEYIETLEKGRFPFAFKKGFRPREQIRYSFLMQLFGGHLSIPRFKGKYSGGFLRHLWKELLFFRLIGSIRKEKDRVVLTEKGMYHWTTMMKEFFSSVNAFRDHCRGLIES